jgi:N,N'-diacetyllegionaminate synthase
MIYIAETCQNHNGNFETLRKMVYEAANSGATHCKIQGLYSDELTQRSIFEDSDRANRASVKMRPYEIEYARLKELDLSETQESDFVRLCEKEGIIPMITVFTHEGARRAKDSGFKSIKIASYDCSSYPLIEEISSFAEELIVSTGAMTEGEIKETQRLIMSSKLSQKNTHFLHCVSEYPTRLDRLNLNRIKSIKKFIHSVGYSDHFANNESRLKLKIDRQMPAKVALYFGASVIEQHFTILPKNETKDGPISVTTSDIKNLMTFIIEDEEWFNNVSHDFSEIFGDGQIDPSVEEWQNRKYYRGRVASRKEGKQIFSWEKWIEA